MSKVTITKRQAKDLYNYFYDAANRFAASGVWSMDTAILVIAYNAKIRDKKYWFKFQEIKNFKIVYENDATFRYLISQLLDLDGRQ